ncbi:MAG: zinc-dependent metalloprotease family protein [Sulfurovum sp.]|nr:zinc-dependent metalloprotease family protein [Sulfurovum sp.]
MKNNRRIKNILLSIVMIVSLNISLVASEVKKGFTTDIQKLFTTVETLDLPSHVILPSEAIVGKFVKVNSNALANKQLRIELPENNTIIVNQNNIKKHSNGSKVWFGDTKDGKNASIIISQYGKAFSAVIRIDGKVYKLINIESGLSVIMEVSPNEPRPELAPIKVPDTDLQENTSEKDLFGASADVTTQADDGSVIDVMIAYTTAAMNVHGDVDGINAYIALSIAESNQAYTNSSIFTQLNLVHTVEVTDIANDFSNNLSYMQSTNDGNYDNIHALRDQYGADMVSLFITDPRYCGLAYLNTGDLSLDAKTGFSVVSENCAVGYYSFAHELGHNMGSGHDPENAGTPCGVSSYSCGYQDDTEAFRTVMAYNCAGGCTRVDYFSNPNVTYMSRVTGVANSMDNARSINDTRAAVASWRISLTTPPPPLPPTVTYTLLDTAGELTTASIDSPYYPGYYADYYTFTLTKSAVVTIDMTGSMDPYILLIDSSDTIIYEAGASGLATAQMVRNLEPGKYTIEASTVNASEIGTYTLKAIAVGESPHAFIVPIINYILN